jgi:hypothetical protein
VFVFVVSVYKRLISIEGMVPIPVSVWSGAVRLLGSRVLIPLKGKDIRVLWVVQVAVSVRSWSLVCESPTVCVCVCVCVLVCVYVCVCVY